MISVEVVAVPQLGQVLIAEVDGTALCYIGIGSNLENEFWHWQQRNSPNQMVVWTQSPLVTEAHYQITQYLVGQLHTFHLPILLMGTSFQLQVWHLLSLIPRGSTVTYGSIAISLGNSKLVRAVGQACGANPLPLIIPCHRVVAKGGLGGFSGGLSVKKILLNLEGIGE